MEHLTPTEDMVEQISRGVQPEAVTVSGPTLSELLNTFIGRRDVPLSILAELISINRTTLYKILAGTIHPGRNLVLRLGLELQLTFDEMQALLKAADCSRLSGTRRRDAFLINAIIHHQPTDDLNAALENNGFEGIYLR